MMECLDLSWPFDAVHLDNKAAVFPAAGGFVGVTLIYAGANTGDGPGWWVVLFAAGLGLITWLGLALVINLLTDISERVSVDRDMGSGIRFGAYLIASSLILAYASGGDWTSTQATLMEFTVGWPVLPLMLFSLAVEWFYIRPSRSLADNRLQANILPSVLWGFIYLVYSCIVLLIFHGIPERISGGGIPVSGAVLARIPGERYSDYRYEAIFRAYKWDPQVEDHNTVAEHVVLLDRQTARQLEQWAEQLSAETMEIEQAMMERSDLVKNWACRLR